MNLQRALPLCLPPSCRAFKFYCALGAHRAVLSRRFASRPATAPAAADGQPARREQPAAAAAAAAAPKPAAPVAAAASRADQVADVAIVGGGVSGTSLLYTLSQFTDLKKLLLFERRSDFAVVQSFGTSNSQTIHCG
eukprot:GHVT01013789.1.p2 GENE.GHVT01013789.1~~GHVT01013789.1.p2  ORF type:complete len:137 (-),score=45.54 GHVT01013789.1:28-438(-)